MTDKRYNPVDLDVEATHKRWMTDSKFADAYNTLEDEYASLMSAEKLLGNCSCVALDGCSRRRSTSPIHGVVPPASLQSSCVFCTCAIRGVRSERRSRPRRGKRQEGAHHRTAFYSGSIPMARGITSCLRLCGSLNAMVAEDGIEPPTRGFSIPCSTN